MLWEDELKLGYGAIKHAVSQLTLIENPYDKKTYKEIAKDKKKVELFEDPFAFVAIARSDILWSLENLAQTNKIKIRIIIPQNDLFFPAKTIMNRIELFWFTHIYVDLIPGVCHNVVTYKDFALDRYLASLDIQI